MRYRVLTVFIILLTILSSVPYTAAEERSSDTLRIMSIDTGYFPTVRMFFRYTGTEEISGFEVFENGTKMNATIIQKFGSISPADIVFVFDDTGSMDDEIGTMKRNVNELVESLEGYGIRARYALVTFKDSPSLKLPFTTNVSLFTQRVSKLYASGGGDTPEDDLDAIAMALRLNYSRLSQKILILITDAPTHYAGDGSGYSDYTIHEIAEMLRKQGVLLIVVSPNFGSINPKNDVRELAVLTGGLWIDIHSADFGRILQKVIDSIGESYEIQYKTSLKPPGLRKVLLKVYLKNGTVLTAESEYMAPSFNVTPYVPPKPREEPAEAILRKLAEWFNESKTVINQTEPKGVWDYFIEKPYIPKLPEFSSSESNEVMKGIFDYMLEVNRLNKPALSDGDMRYLMDYISNVTSIVTMPNGTVVRQTGFGIYRVEVPGFDPFYVSLSSKSKTTVKHVTFFKKNLNVKVTAHGDMLTAYMPVNVRRFTLTVTLNYVRVSGFVNDYPVFDREFIFPLTDVSDMVLYDLGKALRIKFDKPILDGNLYGTLELEGGLYSPIGEVYATGDLISIDAPLTDLLNGLLGSIEIAPSIGYTIEKPNGDEFSADIAMSVPISDFQLGTHPKIFLYYTAYKVFDSDFLRKHYLYPKLVDNIEKLSWEARYNTYLSYGESNSFLPPDNELLQMLKNIEGPGWISHTSGSFISFDWDVSYGQSVSTNLLPLTSRDSRILYHAGIEGDVSLNLGGNDYLGYGVFIGPVKLGIGGTIQAKVGFSAPLLGLTVIDPPTNSSTLNNITVKLVNFTAEDLNDNGYFDGILLKFSVSGLPEGNYTVYSPLYSSNGTFLISGVNESVHGNTSSISVWIPGQYVYQTHYSGNVSVRIIVQNSGGALIYSGTASNRTFKLDYRLFDHVSLNATINTSKTKNGLVVTVRNIPPGVTVKPYLTKPGWFIELNSTNGSFFIDGMHIKKLGGRFSIVIELINKSTGVFLGSIAKNVSLDPTEFSSEYPWILNVRPTTVDYSPAVLVEVNVTRASNLSLRVTYGVGNYTKSTTAVFYNVPTGIKNLTVPLDPGVFIMTGSRMARIDEVVLQTNGLTTDSRIVNSTFTYDLLQRAYIFNATALPYPQGKGINVSFLILSHAGINSTVRIVLLSGNYTAVKYLILPKEDVLYNVSLLIPLNFSAISPKSIVEITVYDPSDVIVANERLRVNLSMFFPKVNFHCPATANTSSPVKFEDASIVSNGRIVKWIWNFGDGASGEGNVTSHWYTVPGNYTVTLTVWTKWGTKDSASKVIRVIDTTPPNLTVLKPVNGETGKSFIVRARASDNWGIRLIRIFVDGRSVKECTSALCNATIANLSAGNHTLTITAVDLAGNSVAKNFSVRVPQPKTSTPSETPSGQTDAGHGIRLPYTYAVIVITALVLGYVLLRRRG